MAEARRAWIGLGGNLGEVSRAFDSALEALAATPGLAVLARSALYRTPAWGVLEQPSFLNAAVALESRLGPIELLDRLMAVERQHGRDRTRERRWGPRRLDLDLLAIDGVVLQHPRLLLPHPRAHERAFVLVPWAEIAPDFLLPGHGRLADLRDALDRSGIEAIP
ncbi:MAG: 2-amino-4-hydroxy-6-hydroxymethyldihydropteridine diphosphokinase [Xanthomonadaceae bacterium]|jgi:2-amino-4-hydroxy-6-hydroxymethyldihydropteridine diphosphokinase|nr:2-amino-4-hydroxy-6-hydroxymethyldihydropteridine diphosphokinase [Xanthomonadaceae bacterium]